ncbi:MAG: DUF1565 domain-containing protein, partial [Oscillatoriales cyanobacterium SM2_3_0]|nr:DUF1565 domain-containing protein [Oscillatoriales cyanobacterium SM2_3_0]
MINTERSPQYETMGFFIHRLSDYRLTYLNWSFPQFRIFCLAIALLAVLGVERKSVANDLTFSGTNPFPNPLIQAQSPSPAQIIYVDPTTGIDSAGSTGTQASPLKTITAALQRVKPGVTIQLAPGIYSQEAGEVFPLLIPDGVILRGDSANNGQNILIVGGGNFVSPTFARQNVTLRTAEGASQILGVTITNPNTRGTALWIETSNPTVMNSTFVNSKRDGIFISAEANPKVTANIFAQNEGNGISVARSGQGEIRNNLFQNTGFGISVNDQAAPLIAENKIIENQDGIVVSHTATPTLRNNLIEKNVRDGVVAIAQAQPDMGTASNPGQNIIQDNGRHDVFNATRGLTIGAVGNQIDPEKISGEIEFVAATVQPPNVSVGAGSLSDLRGHWAQPFIEALIAQRIMSGFEDGSFRPDAAITRVQFATIVQKAFNPAPQQPEIEFPDVADNFWGYQAIQAAYRAKFLSGFPDGKFRPNDQITRVQSLVGLANGLGYPSGNPEIISRYQDASAVPAWALQPLAGATEKQLVVNYPQRDRLNPNQPATRADVR